jgi:hypothetical protein
LTGTKVVVRGVIQKNRNMNLQKNGVTETRIETERLTSRYNQFEPPSLLSRRGTQEMRHSHDTNKCKNIMKVTTKYHPKDMMFYETCTAKAHILAAIGKDSIGLLGYLEMAFERLGISILETTRAFGHVDDFESTYNKDNKKTSESKIKRATDKLQKLRMLYQETLLPKMASMEHRSGVGMEMDRKRDEEAKRKEAIYFLCLSTFFPFARCSVSCRE